MSGGGTGSVGEMGARRMWLIAVVFGLVSSAVLGGIVWLAMRPSGSSAGTSVDGAADPSAETTTSTGATTSGLPSVAVIGDSITEMSVDELTGQLADRWDLLIDGRSGYTIAEQLPAARALAADEPVQVVVNLGSNDVARLTSSEQPREELAEMVALFPAARCIHLVTVNEGIVWNDRSYRDGAVAVNEAIGTLAAADPRVRVVDWSAAVAAAEAGADGQPGVEILYDDVHPGADGRQLLAELYDEALSGCPT